MSKNTCRYKEIFEYATRKCKRYIDAHKGIVQKNDNELDGLDVTCKASKMK